MTTQDKIVARIGPINVYAGGYLVPKRDIPKLLLEDRLLQFLNVNPRNENKVNDFCRKYAFMPRNVSKGWTKAFEKEQKEIRDIVLKMDKEGLGQEDFDEIDKKRKFVHKQKPVLLDKKQFQEINITLQKVSGNMEVEDEFRKETPHDYLIESNIRYDSISSIWDELYSYIKSKQTLRKCIECKNFFRINQRSPWQKFCGDSKCKDNYHNKKRREK